MRATHVFAVLATLLPAAALLPGQQQSVPVTPPAATAPASRSIHLNVVVTPKSGPAAAGLQQGDFALMDNKTPRAVGSFQAVSGEQQPVKVVVLIDAVNTNFSRVAYVRGQVQAYLKAGDGVLTNPTMIAVLTDKGTQLLGKEFSTDRQALSAALEHFTIGLRELPPNAGFWGADDRVKISLTAVQQLTGYVGGLPGRKVVIWVSPGWPLLSGPRVELDGKQEDQIFGNVVLFSRELQQADVTLYNINPLGPGENLIREDYYEQFVKGVSKPSQTDLADLSLQVLAIQSGGLSLNGSSDVAGGLRRCVADTRAWYEISFQAPVAEQPNEYHSVQVVTDKPGLSARSRTGYYDQP